MNYEKRATPNFSPIPLEIEFLMLHYTACDLETTLDILSDPVRNVSAHLVIDEGGKVYELVQCMEPPAFRAHHAGESRWFDGKQHWAGFNDFTIGIEIVNYNGNFLTYTDAQYAALKQVVEHLRTLYPKLNSPERVIGHEQVAGWRGKVDPGHLFDWERFFKMCYPDAKIPIREPVLPKELQQVLLSLQRTVTANPLQLEELYPTLNLVMETSMELSGQSKTKLKDKI